MALKIWPLFLGIVITMASACSQEVVDKVPSQEDTTESGVFDDFRYPERYAAIVEAAESGDERSIFTLARYYANSPKTDLRNLEYWGILRRGFIDSTRNCDPTTKSIKFNRS